MTAILTGDIVNSRAHEVANWLLPLKEVLTFYGTANTEWEIYRGDSFQLSVAPSKALLAALHIRAKLKQQKNLDVRIAIGIGSVSYTGNSISESNGEAYINSGKCFEELQKQHLAIATNDKNLNQTLNIMLDLISLTIDSWTPAVAEAIKTAIENPKKNQKELATLLHKSQSNVSELLNRGGFDEVLKLNNYYQTHIPKK